MNPPGTSDLGLDLGINNLPYLMPIHPALVHFTIGLFIIGVFFDVAGAFYSVRKRLGLTLPIGRGSLFDIGWYNLLAATICTFFTVIFGFFELYLAQPSPDLRSSWGLNASQTLLAHGLGGTLMLTFMAGLTIWRGFQRYRWRRGLDRQVQWSYLLAAVAAVGFLFVQGKLGGQLSEDFGIHNTTVNLLRLPDRGASEICKVRGTC